MKQHITFSGSYVKLQDHTGRKTNTGQIWGMHGRDGVKFGMLVYLEQLQNELDFGDSPHKGPVTRKMFQCHDVIIVFPNAMMNSIKLTNFDPDNSILKIELVSLYRL